MRCIEIVVGKVKREKGIAFTNNMRCIEIVVGKVVWLITLELYQQHEMY